MKITDHSRFSIKKRESAGKALSPTVIRGTNVANALVMKEGL